MIDFFDQTAKSPASTKPRTIPKAVALKHEKETGGVPRVVATGMGAMAEKILELAFANGVKVREDADLVEVLSALEVDSPIPLEAYMAVAEILAYVYKMNGHAAARKVIHADD